MDATVYNGVTLRTVTIALAGATSGEVDLGGYSHFTLITPSALDSGTITFLAAEKSNGTFVNLYDVSGTEVQLTGATNEARAFPLLPATFGGIRYIKIRNGLAAAPATQAEARTFYITART